MKIEMEMEANIGTVRYDARFGLRFTVHRLQLFCTPGFPKVLLFLRSQNPIRSRVVRRQASPCGSTASRRWIIEERRLCACLRASPPVPSRLSPSARPSAFQQFVTAAFPRSDQSSTRNSWKIRGATGCGQSASSWFWSRVRVPRVPETPIASRPAP